MGFVRFTETGKSYTPRASVSTTGLIGLNDGARKRFGVDGFTHCILYYDADTKRIGIEFTSDSSVEGAQKIRFRPTGADIAGKSFLSFFGIQPEETLLFPVVKDNETGFLIIDTASGKARGKSKSRRAGEVAS